MYNNTSGKFGGMKMTNDQKPKGTEKLNDKELYQLMSKLESHLIWETNHHKYPELDALYDAIQDAMGILDLEE